jgi:hypothetical protein
LSPKHTAPFLPISLALLERPSAIDSLHRHRASAGDEDFLA